jgi:Asp-tRNA(Asn)/Glu-tRNA(Gln) amidotransferase A subunit family amidase
MLEELTALGCLRSLETGELSGVELAEATLARIQAAGDLNAVAALDREAALAAAAQADAERAAGSTAPLLGLPLTIKDTIGVAGLPFRSGSLAREGHVAGEDATVVARLSDLVVGADAQRLATEAEQLRADGVPAELRAGRRTRSTRPDERRLERRRGALIGRGASIAGIGTDGGGSIRVPSHYNGIVGHRPSAGSCPRREAGRSPARPGCSTWCASARWGARSTTSRCCSR